MRGERSDQGWPPIDINVGGKERLASMFLGGGLIAYALSRRSAIAKLMLIPGALLLARGRSGRSLLYTLFDVSTASTGGARRQLGRARRGERGGEAGAPAEREEPAGATMYEASPDAPHPRVPGTHEHPVPPTDLGAPAVRVTEKLMSEIAADVGGSGRTEPEPESER